MKLTELSNGACSLSGTCRITGKAYTTGHFSKSNLKRWQTGTLVQDALPELSAEDREFLISGISPEGWNSLNPE